MGEMRGSADRWSRVTQEVRGRPLEGPDGRGFLELTIPFQTLIIKVIKKVAYKLLDLCKISIEWVLSARAWTSTID